MKKLVVFIAAASIVLLYVFFAFFSAPDPDTLLKKARREFDAGRYEVARQGFMKVREMTKLSSGQRCEASIFHATCFVRENNYKAGAEELTIFIKEYANSFWTPQAYFDLAHCYRNRGNIGEARRLYHEIIAKFPITSWAEYSGERLQELGP